MKIKNLLIALFTFLIVYTTNAAQFTPGNIIVLRLGDGVAALSNASAAMFLDEYTPAGVLVQSIMMPTVLDGLNRRLVNSGSATSNGYLSTSTDGRYILLCGYDTTVGVTSVNSIAGMKRSIGVVDMFGNVNTQTYINDGYTTDNIRSVASDNGINLWISGAGSSGSGGVRYTTLGTSGPSTQISTSVTNTRNIHIFNNQLYVSSSSGAFRLSTVGTGLPTASGQTIVNMPGMPTSATSPYDFSINPDGTIAYVADDRSIASGGGIQKWTQSGGTWSLAYTLNTGLTNSCRGVTVDWSGTNPVIYATTSETSLNKLVTVTDVGAASSFTTLVTAATNTIFRGITFAPNSATIVSNTTLNGGSYDDLGIINGSAVTLSGNIQITGTLSFSPLGPVPSTLNTGVFTSFFSPTATNPVEDNANGYIIGNCVMDPRAVGTGSLNFLGFSISGGVDNIGNVTLSRITGTNGIVTVGGSSGIASKWDVSSTNPPTDGRNLSLSWVPNMDNGKNTALSTIWKSTDGGTTWDQQGLVFPTISDPRVAGPVSINSFSQWTVSDAPNPLPVELSNFIAHSIRNEVILDWSTTQELNNSHFDIERVKIDLSGKQTGNFSKIGTVRGAGTTNNITHYKYTDNNIESGKYLYRLNQVDYNGNTNVYVLNSEIIVGVPNKFDLSQNYPNPFNPVTKINYELPEDLNVSLKVYDINGKEVAALVNEVKAAGYHTVEFNGMNMASGIYFIRLNAGQFSSVKKMNLIK